MEKKTGTKIDYVPFTWIKEIDALLSHVKIGGGMDGEPTSVSFSFPYLNSVPDFYGNNGSGYSARKEHESGFGLNGDQILSSTNALSAWSNVSNINFTQVSESESGVGDIRISWTRDADYSALAWAYFPSSAPSGSDVWINADNLNHNRLDKYSDSWDVGTANYFLLLHELGHALGLVHTFDGTTEMPVTYDNWQYSAMAYQPAGGSYDYADKDGNSVRLYPETPMVFDIAAMQHMYGVNSDFNKGDDIYTFDNKAPFLKTIWDAGGNNSIDISNFSNGSNINLNEGSYSRLYFDYTDTPATFGIAFGVTIEKVFGGSGDDRVVGSGKGNGFYGGEGLDTFVLPGTSSDYSIIDSSSDILELQVVSDNSSFNVLSSVERLVFADISMAFDIHGSAGQLSRLYKAAFGDNPDLEELGLWIKYADAGKSLLSRAEYFIETPDFQLRYGSSFDNESFVDTLYLNILGRDADDPGLNYWTSQLENENISRADAFIGFTDSPEYISLVGQDAILYKEYGGLIWV